MTGGYTLPGETFYEVLSAFANISMGVQGETVNEILYKMLQPTGIPVTPNDTTYNYLCLLVYYMSERHILNDNITSKYAILDELYEALAFNRNPAPNRLVYYNDAMLNDSKYAVGSTFCGATITAHIYNNNIKVGAIEFDQTVTDLENAAFRNTHINSISLPTEVVTIGDNAFFQCYYLNDYSWNLPATITTIGDYAFASTDIRELRVPAGTTSIGAFAFSGDTSLTITMMPTVPPTLAGSNEFTGVQRILVPESSYNDYITAWSQWSSIIRVQQIPLNFTAGENNSTVKLKMNGTIDTSYEYSRDNITWSPYTIGDTLTLTNAGDKVYFRGDNSSASFSYANYMQFEVSGNIAASGNIMSILDKTMESTTVPNYGMYQLFSLCYNLTSAPKMPATTLGTNCYQYMFQNCTALTDAPELPATTLSANCYQYMFQGCSSLTTVPALTAATLASRSYMGMFRNCTALTELTVYANDITANNCIQYWLDGTATGTTGILHSLGSADFTGQVPSNWNIFYGNLTVTSDTTISSRIGYENINVSNNAVLTISNTFVQVLDTITVEGGSQIRVSPTSVLVAGEGGIVTADVNGLYSESYEIDYGTILFNMTEQNQHPLATVELYLCGYTISESPEKRIWQQFGLPVYNNIDIEKDIAVWYNYWAYDGGWLITNGDGVKSKGAWTGFNTTTNRTTPGGIFKWKGNLYGNTNKTFTVTPSGYFAFSNSFAAKLPIKYILNLLKEVNIKDEIKWAQPPLNNQGEFTVYNLNNIDTISAPKELYSMAVFFVDYTNQSNTKSFTINYNDAILAYYKQKYNF